ncbi:Do family serine endopeptidase [Phenylobacterium sp.]|uniref:Do family serine endopeptidase n=1 Tax=Phenylobacterium sp. TaxID=1871053 RepID=UPI0019AA3946|nr:Do family serine endopeptidase [Phenylobacterium sp.]MBC7167836.1 Do family serine endopeptidase [Phenylobacterium sp.]
MTSKKTGYLLGAVAGVGVAAAALAATDMRIPHADRAGPSMPLIRTATAPVFAPPPGAPLSFADIFDQVSPAVVSVNVTSRADTNVLRQIPGLEGLPFGIIPRGPGGGEEGEEEDLPTQLSAGSGFFISADGYIVTNNHVVENAEEIKVVLKDEREFDAEIVGRDEATDLAVIKIKGSNFPYVSFENDAVPRVGDWVIAVGNPFGLTTTATAGIVSAYGRDIGETFVDFIQIDAPINRGNSGGPTFDIYGRVIGVNTAIFSPSGGSVGIGFAIPAATADSITKQLIAGGKVTRGYIGATIQNYTRDMAEAQGLGDQRGAIVSDTVPGGPSARAGLQPGDIIISVNGAEVETSSELTREVAKASAGDMLRLQVIRDGSRRTVEVRSGVRPTESELAANDNGPDGSPRPGQAPAQPNNPEVLGMSLAPLDDAARRAFGIPANVRGVVIAALESSSDAARKGLRRGDVIVRANSRTVNAASDLAAEVDAARKAGRPSVLIGVNRDGRTLFLPLDIEG